LQLQSKTPNFFPSSKDQITESLCHFPSGLLKFTVFECEKHHKCSSTTNELSGSSVV